LIDHDAELQLHNERLRAEYDVVDTDRVLDIGLRDRPDDPGGGS
jgi:hypothetical protein